MLTRPFDTLAPVLLASNSPRRRRFLEDLGLRFRIMLPHRAEAMHGDAEDPAAYARRAAREKAADVAMRDPGAAVIGADTIVVLGDEIMGKPRSAQEALSMLMRLSGADHTVFTACCVFFPDGTHDERVVSTRVSMARYDEATLRAYLRCGEGRDKAGSYALQGVGAFLVRAIDGSWSSVVGLPMAELVEMLLARKIIAPRAARVDE